MVTKMVSILAIDDNPDNLVSLKAEIRELFENTVVYTALTGEKGLTIAHEVDPDVILLDIAMPGMDGYEICRRLKAHATLKDIPVIFLTAVKSDKKSRIEALQCGAEAFLVKPIDESELLAQIRAMLKIRAANVEKRNEMKRLESIVEEKTRELRESEERYRNLYDYSGIQVGYYTPDGRVISFNKKALTSLGGTLESYVGRQLYDIFSKQCADFHMNCIKNTLAVDKIYESEACINTRMGLKCFAVTCSKICKSSGELLGVQIALHDISKRKEYEDQLLFMSYRDQLTGLYNRRYFEKTLTEIDTPENLPISLIVADVNGLKLINDSVGHTMGDKLLLKTAYTLKEICRPIDIVARLSGDEFVVILPKTEAGEAHHLIELLKYRISNETVSNFKLSLSFGTDSKVSSDQPILTTFANAENQLYRNKIYEHSSARSSIIEIIMNTLFEKSSREMRHSKRVSEFSEAIALKLGYGTDFVNKIRTAGLLHDIGKIGVDERILNKPGDLDKHEWNELKKHPEIGWRILSSTNEFADVANFILEHHEKWDGSGYPKGLSGEQISFEARIITIADAYDAMRNDRSYKNGKSKEEAIEEMRYYSGIQFDPSLVDVFLNEVLN